jgi:solute carrier family 35 protein E3
MRLCLRFELTGCAGPPWIVAVLGMIWYGNASAKPGGKERRSILPVRSASLKGSSEEKASAEK